MKRMRVASLAVAALAAMSLAACSEESGGDGDSEDVPADAIKVGMIGDYSVASQFGNAQPERISAVKAALDAINKDGGIGGKDVVVIPCDQEGDPNKAVACARKLADEGVIATVGDSSTDSDKFNPILVEAGIPRIGPLPLGSPEFTAPNNYPLSGGAVTLFGGVVNLCVKEGHKNIAVVSIETPQSGAVTGLLKPVFEKTGAKMTKFIQIPLGSADLSQFVKQATDSGADCVMAGLNSELLKQFLVTSEQQGAKYAIGAPNSALSQADIDELGGTDGPAEGTLLAGPFPPSTASGFDSIDQFNDEMDAREKGGDENAEQSKRDITIETWLAAHAFAEIAKLVDGEVTVDSFNKALAAAKDVDLGDISPPWTPSAAGSPLPRVTNLEGYFLVVKDGKIELYSDERQQMF